TFLTEEPGLRQFLDVGASRPAADNTHEIAQRLAPESRAAGSRSPGSSTAWSYCRRGSPRSRTGAPTTNSSRGRRPLRPGRTARSPGSPERPLNQLKRELVRVAGAGGSSKIAETRCEVGRLSHDATAD